MMFRRLKLGLATLAGFAATAALAQDATVVRTPADLRAQVAAMRREMAAGQTFAWKPVLQASGATAALEIWRAPGKPAVHPDEAEYAVVVEGSGALESGGQLVDPVTTRADLIEGTRIEGGQTRPLRPGDVFLIPAGVPHGFTVDGGNLVLLGTKLPRR